MSMQIQGFANIHAPHQVGAPHHPAPASKPGEASKLSPTDELSISAEADSVSRARETAASGQIRADKVALAKEKLASGVYDDPAVFAAAVDRMFDSLG